MYVLSFWEVDYGNCIILLVAFIVQIIIIGCGIEHSFSSLAGADVCLISLIIFNFVSYKCISVLVQKVSEIGW